LLRLTFTALSLVFFATTAMAGSYKNVARGTALRVHLMSAVRPHAEWQFGEPVEFVVDSLRVAGDIAYAELHAQRPGGGKINMAMTPMAKRDDYNEYTTGTDVRALLKRSGKIWVAVWYEVGTYDPFKWETTYGVCDRWAAVIPEMCN